MHRSWRVAKQPNQWDRHVIKFKVRTPNTIFPLGFGRIGMDDSFNISVQEVHYKILLIEQILVGIVENDCLNTDSSGRMVLIYICQKPRTL